MKFLISSDMIDCDLIHIFLRKTIGVFDTCICLLHVELDVTDVDFRERVSRDGYSSTTGIQLSGFWIFWYVNVGYLIFWWYVVTLGIDSHWNCVKIWRCISILQSDVCKIGFRWISVHDRDLRCARLDFGEF